MNVSEKVAFERRGRENQLPSREGKVVVLWINTLSKPRLGLELRSQDAFGLVQACTYVEWVFSSTMIQP